VYDHFTISRDYRDVLACSVDNCPRTSLASWIQFFQEGHSIDVALLEQWASYTVHNFVGALINCLAPSTIIQGLC
jgi:hypothetical protein